MDLQEISRVVANIGIPGTLLIYLVWRLDKFLTFLCGKLTVYNKEFKDITYAINAIVEELRQVKQILTTKGKQ